MHRLCKVSWQAFLGIWRRQSFPMGHACRKTDAKVLQLWRNRKHRWSWQSRSQRIPQFLRWLSISLYRAKRQVLMPNCLGIKQVRRSGFRCLHRRLSSHDWYQKPQRWSAFVQEWWPLRHDKVDLGLWWWDTLVYGRMWWNCTALGYGYKVSDPDLWWGTKSLCKRQWSWCHDWWAILSHWLNHDADAEQFERENT